MKQHVALGDMIVRDVPDIELVRAGIRHHHERWDGDGYLDRLEGEEIPLIARILAVGDAFSAMTTTRPYRKALDVAGGAHPPRGRRRDPARRAPRAPLRRRHRDRVPERAAAGRRRRDPDPLDAAPGSGMSVATSRRRAPGWLRVVGFGFGLSLAVALAPAPAVALTLTRRPTPSR